MPIPQEFVPQPSWHSLPFWEGARRHELLVQRCTTCAGREWNPQMACSVCHTETLEWEPVAGSGIVYSFTVVERPQMPGFAARYVVAIVELDEGPRMLTNLVDVEPQDIEIGMRVAVRFEDLETVSLYTFAPAGA